MIQNLQRVFWVGGILTLVGFFGGCASVSIRDQREGVAPAPSQAPRKIFVEDFANADAETARILSNATVARLREFVAPAWRVQPGNIPAESGWLVSGSFERIKDGNTWLRIGVGFGVGRSAMRTTVSVYAIDPQRPELLHPFLIFKTEGGSGAQPGLVTMLVGGPVNVPIAVVQVGAKTYSEFQAGPSDDASRSARMIAAVLSEYMAEHGFAVTNRVLRPKRNWRSSPVEWPLRPLQY